MEEQRNRVSTHLGAETPFFGWRIVAAAFIVAVFGWGTGFYGPPVYIAAIRQAHGWPIAIVSGAVTLHFLVGVAIIAKLPTLYRRFGLPAVTFAGAVLMALGVIGWAIARSPWHLYAAALLTGTGWSALGAAAVNAVVAPWFVVKRPAALSMAFNGGSIGGVIFSPLWVALIGAIGFPAAAVAVDVVMIAVLGCLAKYVLSRRPETMGQLPDGASRAAEASEAATKPAAKVAIAQVERLARDRSFVSLCVGISLALFAQIGLIAQLVSVLVPALGPQGAGLAAGLSTVAAVAGRMAIGWWAPPGIDWRQVAAASAAIQAFGCGVLILAGHADVPLLLVGVTLFGLGVGNAISVPPLIAQNEFSPDQAAKVVALSVAISQGVYAFAPAAFGLLRQFEPDRVMFWAAAIVQAAAAMTYLLGARRQMPTTEREQKEP